MGANWAGARLGERVPGLHHPVLLLVQGIFLDLVIMTVSQCILIDRWLLYTCSSKPSKMLWSYKFTKTQWLVGALHNKLNVTEACLSVASSNSLACDNNRESPSSTLLD